MREACNYTSLHQVLAANDVYSSTDFEGLDAKVHDASLLCSLWASLRHSQAIAGLTAGQEALVKRAAKYADKMFAAHNIEAHSAVQRGLCTFYSDAGCSTTRFCAV